MSDQAEQLRKVCRPGKTDQGAAKSFGKAGLSRVIAFASGKGGVGKTSLVVNLGLSLTRIGYRVVVIDADLGLANVDVMINTIPRYNLADVINGSKKLREVIFKGPLDLKIIPGGSGLYDLANLDQVKRKALLDQFIDLETEGDFILVDTAAGISRNVINFVSAADDFILVTTPEPTALTDAYGMLKVVRNEGLREKSHVLVNSTRNYQEGQKVFNGLKRVVKQYMPAMELDYLGDVRYDSAVKSAVHELCPFVISNPRSPASIALNRIAWRIAADEETVMPEKKGIAGFINRLKKLP